MADTVHVHAGPATWSHATVHVGTERLVVSTLRVDGELHVCVTAVESDDLPMAELCQEWRDDHNVPYCRAAWCERCNAARKENHDG